MALQEGRCCRSVFVQKSYKLHTWCFKIGIDKSFNWQFYSFFMTSLDQVDLKVNLLLFRFGRP